MHKPRQTEASFYRHGENALVCELLQSEGNISQGSVHLYSSVMTLREKLFIHNVFC